MNELKDDLKAHVERLLAEGVSQREIEIELIFYMKKIIYPERYVQL